MLEQAEQQTVYSQIKNYNFQEKKISKGAKKTAHVPTVEIAGCKVKEITNRSLDS